MMPALFTSTSTSVTPSANSRTDAKSCRSSLRTSTLPEMAAAASSPFAGVAHRKHDMGSDAGQFACGDETEAAVGTGDNHCASGEHGQVGDGPVRHAVYPNGTAEDIETSAHRNRETLDDGQHVGVGFLRLVGERGH